MWTIPKMLMSWTYTVNHGGQTFGINMMYFAWGYIIAVSFLKYSNYVSEDFFDPIIREEEDMAPRSHRNNLRHA